MEKRYFNQVTLPCGIKIKCDSIEESEHITWLHLGNEPVTFIYNDDYYFRYDGVSEYECKEAGLHTVYTNLTLIAKGE